MKNNETGRSMIEMLGVLAIVGVLSVGGITGYSKAMTKFKTNKLREQLNTISTNLMSTFINERSYATLGATNEEGTAMAKYLNIIPDDMILSNGSVVHAFGGPLYVKAISYNGKQYGAFSITCEGIPKEASVILSIDNNNLQDVSLMHLKLAQPSE